MTRPRTGFPFLDEGLDDPGAVLAFAHRGGAFHPEIEGLENTRAAFAHAVALGYRYLETDVHATRDGVLLAFHDAVLDRVTGSRGAIADLDHAEVARALVAEREQIPTLTALFEAFPRVRFNIDIKSAAAVGPLVELIRSTDGYDRVCVSSFSSRTLRDFRARVGPRVATGAPPIEAALSKLVPLPRLLERLLRGRAQALQVPVSFRGAPVVTPRFVARAHAAHKAVHVWTIDDPVEMERLLDLGVDGVMTDRTDLLKEVLVRRGQWTGES